MKQQELTLDGLDPAGCGLRVRLAWRDDRFAHQVELVRGHERVGVLTSCEGDGRERWPPSPPLQQAMLESRDDERVALLVGMAGSSHWSAAVSVCPAKRRAEFDVACRAKQAPARLGSCYECRGVRGTTPPPSGALPDWRHAAQLAVAGPPSEHASAAGNVDFWIGWQPLDGADVTCRSRTERLELLVTAAPASWPRTIRWKYWIAAVEPSGP